MPARHRRGRQLDDVGVAAAEHVLAVEDLQALGVPDQPAAHADARLADRRRRWPRGSAMNA